MVEDYIKTHNLHLFMFFFAFIFIRWGIVFFHADLFYSVLMKIARQNPSEIIVVINGPKNEGLENLCVDFNRNLPIGFTPVQHYYTPVAGKRNGIRVAMEHINPNSDITVLVDSDTVWTEDTLSELLKPFACDQKIGGVTTRQKILDPDRKLVTMFANLLERSELKER